MSQNKLRKVILPIENQSLWKAYKTALDCMWKVEEVDLSKDYEDWCNRLNDEERYFLKHILAFFAAADSIVNINLIDYVRGSIEELEARYFYDQQILIEDVHSEMYSLLIFEYIKNETERETLLNAFDEIECVKRKTDWALKWTESKWWQDWLTDPVMRMWNKCKGKQTPSKLAKRLVAFAIVEGVFFSGSFAAIFFLKTKNVMPGLTFSNELISRDEGLHTDFACLYYNDFIPEQDKLPNDMMVEMFIEAVDIEKKFFTDALPCDMLGMNSRAMCDYIEFVADRLLVDLKQPKHFNTPNPFHFMNNISLEGKTNFFERRVGEYKRFGAGHDDYKILEEF
ncbi:Ribonucleotide reductase subunit 2 [Trabala vishnou gigantina nucleopolyhedrovirus]|uniref:Ribonucleotide reductase subunit 2 n=1 Tax=Trabala vishnou gigantina nucleopolyhedrovirus TaxID=2863583 RepID=UPI002481D328|nr:Ribonucleotide reductase subunit 2 [Trabala vishnou gigantina nucleopolyhedrovirus]QYC92700.1 Ribonucleotide reductase subunit 2 [Trabala vishnou gigantina nucleopolyhedrovirus]